MSRLALLVVCALLGLSWFPASAAAEENHKSPIRALRGSGGTYEVEFEDDSLGALGNQGTIPRITVRQPGKRVLLIRERTSFVPQMLKSVEDM